MDYELGSVCLLNLCQVKSDLFKCLSLSTVKVFHLQVYSWHLYNTNYIPLTHHIQHCLIFHKLRVIGGADGPAPTQPLSRVNEIYTHSGANSQQRPAVDTVKIYHTLIPIRDMIDHRSTVIYFNGENNNIWPSILRSHSHTHTCAENTKIPHYVHYMGSQQNFPDKWKIRNIGIWTK